jgi:ribonucleoside-diphosphate reductase alpha chain
VTAWGAEGQGRASPPTGPSVATDVVRQGGRRRGANMAVLHVSHPDIEEFIDAKSEAGVLENFDLSVGATDAFMRASGRCARHGLVNPRTGAVVREVEARTVLRRIAAAAHRGGDPGLLFLDRIERDNPVPSRGRIEATNPCGEVPLLPYESCNLASVNVDPRASRAAAHGIL